MVVKSWASILDENTRLQAEMLSRSPAVTGHVALMPDAHVGIRAPIGSVIASEASIIPSAVGVDIGCGMIAVQTDLRAEHLPGTLQPLVAQFSRSIPSGVGRGRNLGSMGRTDAATTRDATSWMSQHPHELGGRQQTALSQRWMLGSGNHFLEVCLDEADHVWVVLHSGSRGAGNRLASMHINRAKAQE